MEKKRMGEEIELNLKELFNVFVRRLWIVVLSGTVIAVGALVYCKFFAVPLYQSSTKIYVLNKQGTDITYSDLQTGAQLTKDYVPLIVSQTVTEQVIANMGLTMTEEQLASSISVTSVTDTRVLKITVTNKDAYLARDIANEVREIVSQEIERIMDSSAVKVVDEASIPTKPSSPKVKKMVMSGGLLGALVAAIVVVLIYVLNDTVRTPDDVEKYLGLSVLGVIPEAKNSKTVKFTSRKKKKARR